MISRKDKNADRLVRHTRVRKKVFGTSLRPRLNVYRSTLYVYAQIIDDITGHTLVSSSSFVLKNELKGKTKTDASYAVGKDIAAKAVAAGITEVVFDRGGYIYTGRVAKLAQGAREGGLKF